MALPTPDSLPEGLPGLTCVGCVWRSPEGCRMAAKDGEDPVEVSDNTSACVVRATALDCLDCGACCREGYDSVPVMDGDEVFDLFPELIRFHDDGWIDLHRVPSPTGEGSRCIALEGNGPYPCRIYAHRPSTCRDVAQGEEGCLFARRRVGLSPKAHSGTV